MNYLSTNWLQDWPKAEPYLQEALSRSGGEESIFDLAGALSRGAAWLWTHEDGAALTAVIRGEYTLWYMGGAMNAAEDMLPEAEKHAAGLGYEKVVIFGRVGWQRSFLRDVGYRASHVILEKRLEVV